MGSMIYLHVGRLEIDWGKNSGFIDHNPLFQPSDIAQVPYEYAEDIESPNNEEKPWRIITELKEGLSKPLKLVVERLNLLGYTLNYCINSYELASKEFDYWGEPISFERLQDLIRSIDFSEVHEGKMETFQHLIRKALYPQIGRSKIYNGEEDLD